MGAIGVNDAVPTGKSAATAGDASGTIGLVLTDKTFSDALRPAIAPARLLRLVYGAADPKAGESAKRIRAFVRNLPDD